MKLRVLHGDGPTQPTVTIVRSETLADDDEAFMELVDERMTIRIRDNHLTAEGARVLEELLADTLSDHWMRRQPPPAGRRQRDY